jgi:hypothetical protein
MVGQPVTKVVRSDATTLGGEKSTSRARKKVRRRPYFQPSSNDVNAGFEGGCLALLRQIGALPAGEPGIDGLGARSNHRQSSAADRPYDRNPWIARTRQIPREGDPLDSTGRRATYLIPAGLGDVVAIPGVTGL